MTAEWIGTESVAVAERTVELLEPETVAVCTVVDTEAAGIPAELEVVECSFVAALAEAVVAASVLVLAWRPEREPVLESEPGRL